MRHWSLPWKTTHPDDTALLALTAGVPLDPEEDAHVHACRACAERVRAFAAGWQRAADDVRAEADAEFTDARLDRQRALIMKRLAQHGRPGRVLRFPLHARAARGSRQVARRWVAAAAAAGLLVGVAAGRFVDDSFRRSTTRASGVSAPDATTAVSPLRGGDANDEAFLVELEVAAATPRIEPLRALDAMTPRLRDTASAAR